MNFLGMTNDFGVNKDRSSNARGEAINLSGYSANGNNAPLDTGTEPMTWLSAMEAKGRQNVEKGVGRAAIDATSSYDKARQANERALAARGVNAGSGIFVGKTDEWALARAAAEAGARNRARTEGENQNNGLLERLLGLKMSQYNKNRDFNYNNNSTSNIPTVSNAGIVNARAIARHDNQDSKAFTDAVVKGINMGKGTGNTSGADGDAALKMALNTQSPTNGQNKTAVNLGKSVYLGDKSKYTGDVKTSHLNWLTEPSVLA